MKPFFSPLSIAVSGILFGLLGEAVGTLKKTVGEAPTNRPYYFTYLGNFTKSHYPS